MTVPNPLAWRQRRHAGHLRHAEHYSGLARRAGELYNTGGEDLLAGLRLFDQERGNIQAGRAWASAQALQDDVAAELGLHYSLDCAYIPDSLTDFIKPALLPPGTAPMD